MYKTRVFKRIENVTMIWTAELESDELESPDKAFKFIVENNEELDWEIDDVDKREARTLYALKTLGRIEKGHPSS